MSYIAVKQVHVAAVAISFALFFIRGIWMIRDSPLLQRRWVRILPHVNDTVLLLAGLTAAFMIHQYPFIDGWLSAKVAGLAAYIILGTLGLKRAPTKPARMGFWVAALGAFGYIVAVALTKNPLPWATAWMGHAVRPLAV